jgi:hypothetical protein
MPTPRYGHVCALVKDQTTGDSEIVVAGGGNKIESFDIVEVYNVELDEWRTGTTHIFHNYMFVLLLST